MHRRLGFWCALCALTFGLLSSASCIGAQSTAWPSVHQTNGWLGNVYERALDSNFSVMTDVQWRRMGLVEQPKQLFMVAGIGRRVAPGVRLTLGGGYIASAPYGGLPAIYPTREYQIWYQLQLQQHAGAFDFAHRYRFENRWIHDVIKDDEGTHNSSVRFSHRLRYQLRASHAIGGMKFHGRPIIAIAADEAFLGLTAVERRVAFDQNRASIGVGVPLSATERLEVSYMQQWIANSRLKSSEINNTLLIMFNHALPIR